MKWYEEQYSTDLVISLLMNMLGNSGNKGLRRAKHDTTVAAKHDTTVACQQGNVKQVYIKIKCEHSILLHLK